MAHLLILIHGKLPAGARDLNLVFRYCTRCCCMLTVRCYGRP